MLQTSELKRSRNICLAIGLKGQFRKLRDDKHIILGLREENERQQVEMGLG
jgi:hypothetical protein